ncbi:MAG: SGNH/GDSL hydrolase family protein [Streptosporangiaceae bacterium]
MTWRRVVLTAVAAGLLAVLPGTPSQGTALPPWAHADPGIARSLLHRHPGVTPRRGLAPDGPAPGGLAGCEAGLERARGGGGPRVVIVGASFTAGVGPDDPDSSWAMILARLEHWDAVVYGDPGAGYVRPGLLDQGPVADELARVGLRALQPALVIVQAGHDDIGEPLPLERQRVAQAIALIRAEAPQARIALLTVFPGRTRAPRVYRTDLAIVTAALAADHGVIIMDPLTGRWVFPRVPDRLHPTAGGDTRIAQKVAEILRDHGVVPGPTARGGLICDSAIGVRPLRPLPPA